MLPAPPPTFMPTCARRRKEFSKRNGGRNRKRCGARLRAIDVLSHSSQSTSHQPPMSWHGIHAHDAIVEKFRQALARGKLASSFLFVGPAGVGKRMFALKLAQSLLCETRPEELLDPC